MQDDYQDLVLSDEAALKPIDRLSISLLGSVTIPVNGLDYTLDGLAGGLTNGRRNSERNVQLIGPVGRDWGSVLSITSPGMMLRLL